VSEIKHGTKHAYANQKCRCDLCVGTWNHYMRSRGRAVQRLIEAHTNEFAQLFARELAAPELTPGQRRTVANAKAEAS